VQLKNLKIQLGFEPWARSKDYSIFGPEVRHA